VARSCINIMAPFGVLLLISPQRIEKTSRFCHSARRRRKNARATWCKFALGGLAAIAREAPGTR